MSFTDRHEKAVSRFQPMHRTAARHLQNAFEKPDILRHAPACRMWRKADARAGRKLDLDNIDIGTDARRGDGAADITGFGIFPELLVPLLYQRRHRLFIVREEAGER